MKIHKILIAVSLLIFSISFTEGVVFSEYYKNTVTISGESITSLDENRNSNIEPLDYSSTDIQLVSPGNGLKLDTLIPLHIWDVLDGLGNIGVVLAFGTTPDPMGMMFIGMPSGHFEHRQFFNLDSNTTYYWRVGIPFSDDPIQWSDQWTFITGDSGGEILPSPILISPIGDITVSSDNLTLKWNPVIGALKYQVMLHNIDEDLSYLWGEVNDTEVTNTSWCIKSGFHYEWYVMARNSYAWGTQSEYGRFYTSEVNQCQPDIKANGQDGPITVPSGTPVSIDISLDPGDNVGQNVELWIVVQWPFGMFWNYYSYVYPTGWLPGINPCIEMPLTALSSTNVLTTTLPPADYEFFFLIDDNVDGIPEGTWLDSVKVKVQ